MSRSRTRAVVFSAFALAVVLPRAVRGDESTDDSAWALRPLASPSVPQVRDTEWVRTPIDAFILAALEKRGLRRQETADRATLLRRVSFDLVGLPPTPEEIAAFVADPAADAYERRVDRLLASPRYGERWARHWMDVVHFAETHGHDQDRPRPNAWPYRDYLIRSFNEDKPYARFVEEQVAGDVLFPRDPQALVATAFLAAGPWDESSQMGIQDGTKDKMVARYLDRDDMIQTVMSTFVSATAHCARCHDHKVDPITQDDYYSLQAVFAGVDRVERGYDEDPKVHARRQGLLAERNALRENTISREELLSERRQRAAREEEERIRVRERNWIPLVPRAFRSEEGALLSREKDGSIYSSGPRPEKDSYTVRSPIPTARVRAVRLEVLADARLPKGGPGRQDNGNLHLSEIRLFVARARGEPEVVRVRSASADFNQAGWGIERAIDGLPETAWGIYPAVGASHSAVFAFAEPVRASSESELVVVLDQLHGGGHLIGRVRLSVTGDEGPWPTGDVVPPPLAALLAVSPADRTDAERAELARLVGLSAAEAELANLSAPRRVYAVASEFEPQGNFVPPRGVRAVHVLRRGDIDQPLGTAIPGALRCVDGLDARFEIDPGAPEGTRRAALARWLSHGKNVLTWRSIVNRVWHYHFGRGIVATPNDFGRLGDRPSHPELLDWLAAWFQDRGGSLKALHRVIMTSSVYRQSGRVDPAALAVDSENRLLWRRAPRRLDAESVRDAVLAMSGTIDVRMHGPSARHFVESPGIHVTPVVDYGAFDIDSAASRRRAVYRFVFRTVPDPLFAALDCPDASLLTPVRESTVTPLQALALLHDRFLVRQSEHLAARIEREVDGLDERIARLFLLAYGRRPDGEECDRVAAFAAKHGLANACRIVLNSSEFLFVR